MGVVLVLHGRGDLADVEDGRVRLAADHALAGEDGCFVLMFRVVSGGVWWGARFAPSQSRGRF